MAKSSDLLFRILGKDVSASKAMKGVGHTAGGVGKRLGGLGMAFAGIGTAAVAAGAVVAVDFGKKSVGAFVDAQDSQAKFEASLAKNGLKSYTADIDELSAALALKTKFDDDATKSGAAVLANFGLTAEQLKQTLPLVQDYAAFTGKDMTSASKALGKAFLGNTKALKDLGIAYKPTGDKAKDMAAIMDLVNDKVGGFAEKQGKTAAGTAQILSNQFGELQEKVGSALLPILMKLAPVGLVLVDWLSKAADGIGIFIDAFSGKSELNEFDGALKVVNNAGIIFREVWDAAAGWVTGTLMPAIRGLADAFMKNVWPAIQTVVGIIAQNLQPVIAALAEFWTGTLLPALQKMWPIVQKIAAVIGVLVAAIAVVVSWLLGKLIPVFLKIASVIAPIVVGALGWVVDAIVGIGNGAKTVWEKVTTWFGKVVTFVQGLPGKVTTAVSGLWDGIKTAFRDTLNWVIGAWNRFQIQFPSFDFDWNGMLPGGEVTVGGWTVDTPNIPMLAKGGIVTRPTLAMVGEAGPEAVIPLSRGGYGYGGGGVVINIHGPVAGPGVGRWLADEIAKAQGSGRVRRGA